MRRMRTHAHGNREPAATRWVRAAGAVGWDLAAEDLNASDEAFPPPTAASPLEMI